MKKVSASLWHGAMPVCHRHFAFRIAERFEKEKILAGSNRPAARGQAAGLFPNAGLAGTVNFGLDATIAWP
jgi:hypothetical protein